MTHFRATHHFGLTVRSLERSKAFYIGLLQFEEVFSWNPSEPYISELVGVPDVDLHSAILKLPGTDVCLELLEYRSGGNEPVGLTNATPGAAHLAFHVHDVDAVWREWTNAGVPSVSAPVSPTEGPNRGGKAVYMIDPDGFRVELIQSARSFTEFAEEKS